MRRVACPIDELVGAGADRAPLAAADGKSGARLERVVVEGRRHVLKHLHVGDDWVMRATGDVTGRAVTLWRTGWLDRLPACIDHTVVGAAWEDRPHSRGGAILMRDVRGALVPALAITPQTLVHGDWKAGNLGSHPDGRTVLLDWAVPGVAPACAEIAR